MIIQTAHGFSESNSPVSPISLGGIPRQACSNSPTTSAWGWHLRMRYLETRHRQMMNDCGRESKFSWTAARIRLRENLCLVRRAFRTTRAHKRGLAGSYSAFFGRRDRSSVVRDQRFSNSLYLKVTWPFSSLRMRRLEMDTRKTEGARYLKAAWPLPIGCS